MSIQFRSVLFAIIMGFGIAMVWAIYLESAGFAAICGWLFGTLIERLDNLAATPPPPEQVGGQR